MFAVCLMVGGGVSEKNSLCVFNELYLACFLVICDCTHVLLVYILFCDNWMVI